MSITASNSRDHILASARDIAVSQGAGSLTIEAVAKRARMSKGGVLYHFKSKRALMTALIEDYVAHLDLELQSAMDRNRGSQDPFVDAFPDWFSKYAHRDSSDKVWGSALFAVQAFDPALLEPLRVWYERLFERIRTSSFGPEKAATVVLACEGLFFIRMYGLDCMKSKERDQFLQHLLRTIHS